ncbi:Rieske (2Fe-2S) protein [Paenibacillus sp. GCM10023252]|uniref:Rieske (2Fe-2S) protein n=1 Tax=Paenibacillus sp. GCM10023252 TaxID=3252649 RepID=UPI00361DA40C
MKEYVIGTTEQFPPGSHQVVEVDGRSIGVYNLGGELYALRNFCPHQGAPLCRGLVTPLVTSPAPGQFELERHGEIVRCPWHQWEFDIKTGCVVVDPRMKTRTYDVKVDRYDISEGEGGQVFLCLP